MKLEVGQKLWYKVKSNGNVRFVRVYQVFDDYFTFIYAYNGKGYKAPYSVLGNRLFLSFHDAYSSSSSASLSSASDCSVVDVSDNEISSTSSNSTFDDDFYVRYRERSFTQPSEPAFQSAKQMSDGEKAKMAESVKAGDKLYFLNKHTGHIAGVKVYSVQEGTFVAAFEDSDCVFRGHVIKKSYIGTRLFYTFKDAEEYSPYPIPSRDESESWMFDPYNSD